ncbi:MAG: HipA domain-containing protein [Chitinispirillia bacterium]|jgi:serine/threonine-protein kinase HipA
MNRQCLICRKPVNNGYEFHEKCSKTFFGIFPPPVLDLTLSKIKEYAAKLVLERISVTGVQKKLSLGFEGPQRDKRLTIVGLWGQFILKPPSEDYQSLPENEDTSMHLAAIFNIPGVPHAMIRLASGELAYITKRIDRTDDNKKIAMEDFCQVSERITEEKYKSSVERVGKLLRQYTVYPGLDTVDLFERVVFNYLIGNADMHLKNYSIIETPQGMRLSPAYDLLSTVLVIPEDTEESALAINGKKSKLKRIDFDSLAESMKITSSVYLKTYKKFTDSVQSVHRIINQGFLSEHMKQNFINVFDKRLGLFS